MLKHRSRGLTLLEALIAIVVATILALVGIPAVRGMVTGNHLDAAALQTAAVLRYARAQALGSGVPIGVCAERIWPACAQARAAANAASDAWVIFRDRDGDHAFGDVDEILKVREWPALRLSIASSRSQPIYFDALGAAGSNTTLTICGEMDTQGRNVILANSGRTRSVRNTCEVN